MQNIFSYPILIDDLNANEKKYKISAEPEHLPYLTEVLKVPGVNMLSAEFVLKNNKKEHLLKVRGSVKAEVKEQSVVSLEYFNQKYKAVFELSYDTKATITSQKGLERSLDEDIPEIIIGGKLDLVDLAIEQLALVLNDYPRKPGENFEFTPSFDINEPIKSNPFEVLKTLKK